MTARGVWQATHPEPHAGAVREAVAPSGPGSCHRTGTGPAPQPPTRNRISENKPEAEAGSLHQRKKTHMRTPLKVKTKVQAGIRKEKGSDVITI